MTILGERVDPDGRQVVLDRPGWAQSSLSTAR